MEFTERRLLNHSPVLKSQKLDIERTLLSIKYSKNEALPDWYVFSSFGYDNYDESFNESVSFEKPAYTIGTGVSISIWDRKPSLEIEEEELRLKKNTDNFNNYKDELQNMLKKEQNQLDVAHDNLDVNKNLFELNQERLELELELFKQNKTTTFKVLEALKGLTSINQEYYYNMYKFISTYYDLKTNLIGDVLLVHDLN